MTETFDRFLGAPSTTGSGSGFRGRVLSFVSDYAARVDPPGPRRSVLAVSTLPLRARDEQGRRRPVDLGLSRREDGWAPNNPLVDVALPSRASGSVAVGDVEFRTDLGSPAQPTGRLVGDRELFYANAGEDSDMAILPTATGAETFVSLRSPQAPEQFEIAFDLPVGGRIVRAPDGAIRVLAGTREIGRVAKPNAVDAQGRPVAVSTTVRGSTLELTVAHRGQDLAYPILVDPLIQTWPASPNGTRPLTDYVNDLTSFPFAVPDENRWYTLGGGNGVAFADSGARGPGLYVKDPVNAQAQSSRGGLWAWVAPGTTSYISEATFGPYSLALNGDLEGAGGWPAAALVYGLLASGDGSENTERDLRGAVVEQLDATSTVATSATGEPESPRPTLAVFGLLGFLPSENPQPHEAFLGGATIELDDPEAPAVSAPEEAGTSSDPLWTGGNESGGVFVRAADPGVGVKRLAVLSEDAAGETVTLGQYVDPCDGSRNAPCPQTLAHEVPVDLDDVADGEISIRFEAEDATGKRSVSDPLIANVDRTAPGIDLTGTLADAQGAEISDLGEDTLVVDANDAGGSSSSGVRTIRLKLNGRAITTDGSVAQICPAGGCALNHEFTLDTTRWRRGENQVTVEVVDGAQNVTRSTLTVRAGTVDTDSPVIALAGDFPFAADPAGEIPWVGAGTYKAYVKATDPDPRAGTGVYSVSLSIDDESNNIAAATPCIDSADPCPSPVEFPLDTTTLADGVHTLTARGTDSSGNVGEGSVAIRVDKTPPSLELGGSLASAGPVPAGPLTLSVSATDGLLPASGVERLGVLIDGRQVDGSVQQCPLGACTASTTFTLPEGKLSVGEHTVAVKVWDIAGNVVQRSWQVEGRCGNVEQTTSTPEDVVTPTAARTSILDNHPEVLAPSQPTTVQGQTIRPSLDSGSGGQTLPATDTVQPSELPVDPADPIVVGAGQSAVCLTPVKTNPAATDAIVVAGDSALYANTAPATDTVVRPIAEGVETFTNIRSDKAPENVTYAVTLAPDQELRETPQGTVQVVDTAPDPEDIAGSEAQPAAQPVTPAQLASLKSDGAVSPDAQLADPDADRLAELAAADAGMHETPPTGATLESPSETPPTGADPGEFGATDPSTPPLLPPSDPTLAVDDIAQKIDNDDLKAATNASSSLGATDLEQQSSNESLQTTRDAANQAVVTAPVVVAELGAPETTDSAGAPVPTELSADGNKVTLSVDHRDGDYAYPIKADPWVKIRVPRTEWRCCHVREEYQKVLVRIDPVWNYVGSWYSSLLIALFPHYTWPSALGWGSGWTAVNLNNSGRWITMKNQWWGPMYDIQYRPVYETRKVVVAREQYPVTVYNDVNVWQPEFRLVDDPTLTATSSDTDRRGEVKCNLSVDPRVYVNGGGGESGIFILSSLVAAVCPIGAPVTVKYAVCIQKRNDGGTFVDWECEDTGNDWLLAFPALYVRVNSRLCAPGDQTYRVQIKARIRNNNGPDSSTTETGPPRSWRCNADGAWRYNARRVGSPSGALRVSLRNGGDPEPASGFEAHHIIAAGEGEKGADVSQKFGYWCGVPPNGFINGVWLRGPTLKRAGDGGAAQDSPAYNRLTPALRKRPYHRAIHTRVYFGWVADWLNAAAYGNGKCNYGYSDQILRRLKDALENPRSGVAKW